MEREVLGQLSGSLLAIPGSLRDDTSAVVWWGCLQ